jgi:hypothetical protein
MEILIPVGIILLTGVVGSIIVEIYDYVQMSRWMHQRHMRELKLAMRQLEHPEFFSRTHDVSADEIRKALTSKVTTHLPTGEVEAIIFGEEMADEVIKEARERRVGDID